MPFFFLFVCGHCFKLTYICISYGVHNIRTLSCWNTCLIFFLDKSDWGPCILAGCSLDGYNSTPAPPIYEIAERWGRGLPRGFLLVQNSKLYPPPPYPPTPFNGNTILDGSRSRMGANVHRVPIPGSDANGDDISISAAINMYLACM